MKIYNQIINEEFCEYWYEKKFDRWTFVINGAALLGYDTKDDLISEYPQLRFQTARDWILEKAIPIVNSYEAMTLRQLYYRLVAEHRLTNSLQHYKRVTGAMTAARWDGIVQFDDFVDHDREVLGSTEYRVTTVEEAVKSTKHAVEYWLKNYYKNRWENQDEYVEVWIEKKALQGVFQPVCERNGVALFPCKGYPSLTYIDEARKRFEGAQAEDKEVTILYFGDHDPSGDNIPETVVANLARMDCHVELERVALRKEQIIERNIPPAPTKQTDSRAANWDGLGQVELDAIRPRELGDMCDEAIRNHFNIERFAVLTKLQAEEKKEYQAELKTWIDDLYKDDE